MARKMSGDVRGKLEGLLSMSLTIHPSPNKALQILIERIAQVLRIPVAMINFVNKEYVVFKFWKGLPKKLAHAGRIRREGTFSAYVIDSGKVLSVNDTTKDERFKKHPVVKEYGFKAYLGVPLKDQAQRTFGIICVMDYKPHKFSPEDIQALEIVGQRVIMELERGEYIKKIKQLSTIDELTGLSNRRHIIRSLSVECERAKRYRRAMTVLMIDVDHFRRINDRYGHTFGDFVLKGIAQIVKESLRKTDHIGRYGGEEILVILPETDPEQARVVAERIRRNVVSNVFKRGQDYTRASVSIGVTPCPAGKFLDAEAFLKSTDIALDKAKSRGMNRWVIYSKK